MSDEEMDQPQSSTPDDREHQTPPVPTPAVSGPAIPLPPVQPVTGEGTGYPGGSYALGAFAGNPHLGPPPGAGYAYGPPTQAGPPIWGTPAAPAPAPANKHRARTGALIAAAGVVALAAGVGIGHAAWKSSPVSSSAAPAGGSSGSGGFSSGSGSSGSSGSSQSSGPNDVSSIADKVDPGLVDIDTTLGYQQEEAAGTGIVLTSSGEILTNNHVIDGATTISVTDVGNGKTYSASVVGYDVTQDVAVLQLHNASGLKTASIGNSSNVAVGEDVVGIGNAGGSGGTPSAAGGTVTALDQSITASDESDSSSEQLTNLIETNADIQAGDSGGSLVNSSGQVIGMDTAASAGFSFEAPGGNSGGQGYAIPINEATSLAKQIEAGTASSNIHIGPTAFLGVLIEPSSSSTNSGSGSGFGGFGGFGQEPSGGTSTSGVVIAQVVTSSPAQEAGLAEGDVITSVNGKTVTTPDDLTEAFFSHHPGDSVTIGWTDTSGNTHTAKVQLSSGPPQ